MDEVDESRKLARRHVRFGWAAVAVFMTMGLVLEALHGFKIGWYLEEQHETRRLLFTLAHAHGTLLSLVNIAFGLTVESALSGRAIPMASRLLAAGTVLLPAGFFLGGLYLYGSDPGLGALLAPIGAIAVLIAAALAASSAGAREATQTAAEPIAEPKKKRRR